MSRFSVDILPVSIEPHPNADAIELARIGDYLSVVKKGEFQNGDMVAYIPEASILPTWLISHLGLTGKLAGSDLNRVHAVRLRGVLSQGICLKLAPGGLLPTEFGPQSIAANDDIASLLGVRKHVPEVPDCLKGSAYALETHEGGKFEIEDFKKYPTVIADGEPVSMTEKIHGVCMMVMGLPKHLAREGVGHFQDRVIVSSKGMAHDLLGIADTPENRKSNVYARAAVQQGLVEKAIALADQFDAPSAIWGEVFGSGVQDLNYGAVNGRLRYRAFDVMIDKAYQSDIDLDNILVDLDIERVPVLWKGSFSRAKMLELTNGKTTFDGVHMREGVIVKPLEERIDLKLGRVILKSVSEAYLTRKGGTEYS